MMDYAVQQTLNALAFGSEYALLALGLAIVFSLMNLVNFAHGEIITIAAYTMYLMVVMAVGHPSIVIPMALAAAIAGALLFERVAFRPVRYAPPTTGLLTAFGMSIIVQNAFLLFVSARPRAVPVLGGLNQTITFNGFTIQTLQVMEFVIALVAMGALVVFLKRSTLGLAIRSLSSA